MLQMHRAKHVADVMRDENKKGSTKGFGSYDPSILTECHTHVRTKSTDDCVPLLLLDPLTILR
jgi:hypothetical protein